MAENIRRFVGNDLPFRATISKDGDFNITGKTITMSFQLGSGPVYTLPGNITDGASGKVSFPPTPESIANKGVGHYEIKVDDGSYEVTYAYERIEFIMGVTT